jgi:hypothetical protein
MRRPSTLGSSRWCRGAGWPRQPAVGLQLVGAVSRHGSDLRTAEVVGAAVINGLMFILDGDAMQIR